MNRLRNYALALVLALLSPIFLVLAVAGIAAFGCIGLWLLITEHE